MSASLKHTEQCISRVGSWLDYQYHIAIQVNPNLIIMGKMIKLGLTSHHLNTIIQVYDKQLNMINIEEAQ